MVSDELLKKYEFSEEKLEMEGDSKRGTGYPKSAQAYRLIYENTNLSLEQIYYWLFTHLVIDCGFPREEVIKVIDVMASSEMSSYGGITQNRLAAQQEKAAGYLRGINELIRQLFPIMREMRTIDEQIKTRVDSKAKNDKGQFLPKAVAADMALKELWITVVEGGSQKPSSIYGMAREVGYTTLPDWFFRLHPDNKDTIDNALGLYKDNISKHLKDKLRIKLYQHYLWREKTEIELRTRFKFLLSYIKQHTTTIKMYTQWIKPYLKTVKRLTAPERKMASPELISSFEGSMYEIEFLAKKKAGGANAVVLMNFDYRASTQMTYAEEYQRKPSIFGRVVITFRAYGWTSEQIKNYVKMQDESDFELLSEFDNNIKEALNSFGEDLKKYLEMNEWIHEEELKKKKEEEKKKKEEEELKKEAEKPFFERFKNSLTKDKPKPNPDAESILSPFIALFKAFADIFWSFFPPKESKKEEKPVVDVKAAEKEAKGKLWMLYKNFKKGNGLLAW